MFNDEKDYYYDVYSENKLSNEEIRQYEEFNDLSDEELNELSDLIFDIALTAKKNNYRNK